jgi:hypothetical protein
MEQISFYQEAVSYSRAALNLDQRFLMIMKSGFMYNNLSRSFLYFFNFVLCWQGAEPGYFKIAPFLNIEFKHFFKLLKICLSTLLF